ncbi:MAG: HAD family hydrolase [Candidatus Nanohaloarchaea archaeon]|nr:HAD family hydrolase [Candidatus Nanohaloarchaea archaeon]
MSTELLLLDLDDTVYEYEPCNKAGKRAAWKKAKELGYDMDFERFKEIYQEGNRETKRELAGTASGHERHIYFKKALQFYTGTHRPKHAIQLSDSFWEGYTKEMEIFPGVKKTLSKIKEKGIKIAVVTDQIARIQMNKIEELGIEEFIDLLITSEETGTDKPSSVMFALPITIMDARRSNTVMMGDNLSRDIAGANSLGIESVLFNNEFKDTEQPTWQEPDHEIDEFKEILEVVES